MLVSKAFFRTVTYILVSLALVVHSAATDDQELAKKSQNPIGDLISLPIVGKVDSGLGQTDANAFTLEMKPVYPVHLGSVNMINRLIVPVVYQEELVEGAGSEFGLGDTIYQAFFSPREASKIIWGGGRLSSSPPTPTTNWVTTSCPWGLPRSHWPSQAIGFSVGCSSTSGTLPATAMRPL